MLGISIFCLANWINSSNKGKICAFVCFLTGAYFAGYLSGTRGTLLSIVVIMPVVTFYLTGNIRHCIILILILTLLSVLLVKIFTSIDFERLYLSRIINGFNTILFLNNDDSSISQRIDMWYASLQAIFDAPVFGYGITERFNALKPFLHGSSIEYSHPHNDTLAASIASGILGGITALISLLSILLAGIMAPQRNFEKLLLSLMISVPTLITANVSTIFFNDITSAWLAFSTYLIWVGDFTIDNFDRPNSTG